MRHQKKGKKFHRVASRRRSFMRNLANDLIRNGSIQTTETRAKAVRPVVEKLVTIAKKETLASRRMLLTRVQDKRLTEQLISDIAPRYNGRPGGYLRVRKLPKSRLRDGASVAVVEFV